MYLCNRCITNPIKTIMMRKNYAIRSWLAALLTALLLTMPSALRAADRVNVLVVLTKDKATHRFVIGEDKPTVTIEGTNLKVTCEKASATTTFKLADVIRFTYENVDPTGINELTDDPANISWKDGTLVISQIKAGAIVGIYSLDGKLVKQLQAHHSGTYRLNLSQLPFGVYLVKTDQITYKITRQ